MSEQLSTLQTALLKSLGYETVSSHVSEDKSQVTIFGRMKGPAANFLEAARRLLSASKDHDWDVDPSKVWLLRGSRLVHAYRLIFQGEDVLSNAALFVEIISASPKQAVELQSVELPGGDRYRRGYKRGKGAAPTGQAPVGPNAVQHVLRGG